MAARARTHAPLLALAALTLAGALLRFWDIGAQSYWLDESFSVNIAAGSLGDLFPHIGRTESTPPLYYMLAWGWAQLFGTGEAGLRSLSALFGVATIPVAYLAARELWNDRAGLFAAALVAFNPYFVWYGQEARSYGLLVLLSAVTVWLWARVLNRAGGRRIAAWAATCALALLTHYFAAFLVVPEAAWLVWKLRSRAALLGAGAVALTGALLVPLAAHQSQGAKTAFIASDSSLASRTGDFVKKFVTGESGTPRPLIGALAALLVGAGVVLVLIRGSDRERRAGLLVLGLAAAAAALPLAIALFGSDYFLPRNVIAAYVPLALAIGAGFAAAGRAGTALAAVVCAIAVVVTVDVTRREDLQRDDWRGAAAALGPPTRPRAVIVTSEPQKNVLELYAGKMRPLPDGTRVTEVVTIGNARPPRFPTPQAPQGFRPVERRRTESWELIRYVAPAPAAVFAASLAPAALGPKVPAFRLQGQGPG